ncbi:MAG TPA: IS630 family transposase [Gammaproteobacteria bacterium]|nr:IS630 family transposase [Gammaproteobacteria bacterium]
MPAKKYIVQLSKTERQNLSSLVKTGKAAAYKRQRAQILLKADVGPEGPGLKDSDIVTSIDASLRTVERTRQRLVEQGLEKALEREVRKRSKNPRLDGEQQAHLVALVCSEPPEGRNRWSLKLLASKMVALNHVDSVSPETIRQVLKKNDLKPWQRKEWCIPAKKSADFVFNMENILTLYKQPYDEAYPIICMDESSKQHLRETREKLSMEPGKPERYDTEYERNGTSNLFIFFEPLRGWRRIDVTERRTAEDWALQIKKLVDEDYPQATTIRLVMDNLNTHTGASLYKVFEPKEARRLLDKLEFCYTPKHGSWLNMAEIEFSLLSRQCMSDRMADREHLAQEVSAWVAYRNAIKSEMNWRFTTEDARIKLKHLYPSI